MRALRQELRALFGATSPAFILSVWAAILWVSAWVASFGGSRAIMVAALISAGAACFIAGILGMTMQGMLAGMRSLCVPGRFSVLSYAPRTTVTLLAANVAVPGLLLGVASHSAVPVLLIVNGALAGMLVALGALRTPFWLWLIILVLLQTPATRAPGKLLLGAVSARPEFIYTALIAALPVLLALVVWRWRRIPQGDLRAVTAVRGASSAPPYRGPRPQTGPLTSMRILCTCLDTPCGRPSRDVLKPLSSLAFFVGLVIAWAIWQFGWATGWRIGFAVALLLVWLSFTLPMVTVMRSFSGALAELALIPGLGDGRAQLRLLWRVSLLRPLAAVAPLMTLALVAALVERTSAAGLAQTALWLIATALLGVSYMLAILANHERPPLYGSLTGLLATLLGIVWLIPLSAAAGLRTLVGVIAVVVLVWAAVAALFYAQRLISLPHPFVVR